MEAKENARRSPRRKVRADFPQAAPERATQRHPDGPAPLGPQEVFSNGVALGLGQSLEPVAHGFSSGPRAVKDERDFLWLRVLFRNGVPPLHLIWCYCTL